MTRDILFGPFVFLLVGAAIGVSIGMLYGVEGPEDWGRVRLVASAPYALCGAIAGYLFGLLVQLAFKRWPQARFALTALSITLLVGSLGAPCGWIAVYPQATSHDTFARLAPSGMLLGTVIGTGIGLLLGVIQAELDIRKHTTTGPSTTVAITR